MATAKLGSHVEQRASEAPGPARDPVCGMSVDPATAQHHARHAGHDYLFCSAKCRERFTADPDRYVEGPPAAPANEPPASAPKAGKTLWTCPMHPQILREAPGACPICGMALERMTPEPGEAGNPELRDMTRRFWLGVVLSAPLLAMAMADDFAKDALDAVIAPGIRMWLQFILGTPTVLWCGWPFFERGWASIRRRRLNMFSLIALGTGVAYGYSLVAALMPGVFPATFRTQDGAVPLYFEAAAVIVTLVLLGQILELRARSQTNLSLIHI